MKEFWKYSSISSPVLKIGEKVELTFFKICILHILNAKGYLSGREVTLMKKPAFFTVQDKAQLLYSVKPDWCRAKE